MSTNETVGSVASLLRYPVKSLAGESVSRIRIDVRGLAGDRLWAVRDEDGKFGSGKSTRRFRRMDGLLRLSAWYDDDVPVVRFPDGAALRGDEEKVHDALSDFVGRTVTLAREAEVSHFDEGPVHLVTTSSLTVLAGRHGREVDPRRMRPNLVLDTGATPGFVEEAWVGRRVAVGDSLVLEIGAAMPRCVMVTMEQAELDADERLLHSVTEANDGCLGVVADVIAAGEVVVGDTARLLT